MSFLGSILNGHHASADSRAERRCREALAAQRADRLNETSPEPPDADFQAKRAAFQSLQLGMRQCDPKLLFDEFEAHLATRDDLCGWRLEALSNRLRKRALTLQEEQNGQLHRKQPVT